MPVSAFGGMFSPCLLVLCLYGLAAAPSANAQVAPQVESLKFGLVEIATEDLGAEPLPSGEAETLSWQQAPTSHSVCQCGHAPKHGCGVCTDPGHPAKPKRTLPGDIDRGDCPPFRYGMDDCKRAGSPHCVAPWARCSVNGKYSAWFVGGGAPFWRGRPRKSTEGTWGLDYNGLFGHANVWLRYTCGRNQGGEGAYVTDGGPELLHRFHHD